MKINPFRHVDANPYKKQLNKPEKIQTTGKTDKVEISAEAIRNAETAVNR